MQEGPESNDQIGGTRREGEEWLGQDKNKSDSERQASRDRKISRKEQRKTGRTTQEGQHRKNKPDNIRRTRQGVETRRAKLKAGKTKKRHRKKKTTKNMKGKTAEKIPRKRQQGPNKKKETAWKLQLFFQPFLIVLSVLFSPVSLCCLVLAVLPQLPCPDYLVLLSCSCCLALAVLSLLSCPCCLVLAVLSLLSCPCCRVLAVLSLLVCPCFWSLLSCSRCCVALPVISYPGQAFPMDKLKYIMQHLTGTLCDRRVDILYTSMSKNYLRELIYIYIYIQRYIYSLIINPFTAANFLTIFFVKVRYNTRV